MEEIYFSPYFQISATKNPGHKKTLRGGEEKKKRLVSGPRMETTMVVSFLSFLFALYDSDLVLKKITWKHQ